MSAIGLAFCTALSVSVVCSKCSQSNDFIDVRPETDRLMNCVKCKRQLSLGYYPEYLHANSQRLGQVRLQHCRPLDLLPSQWQLQCCVCDGSDLTSSLRANKVRIGEHVRCPCRKCATVIEFMVDAVRWTEYQTMVGKSPSVKPQKLAITIGEPLPKYGACQHYAKSFRWYRFPCCGKAFPCDECHNAASTDHAMQWATRFICGFCGREHPINLVKKECVCGASPSMARTAHWEGGKGMREQTTMSKKDNKKYRGLSKTVSK